MSLHIIKNVQFTKLVKAAGRLKEFNFRKLRLGNAEVFSVDVCDERGNRIIFHMQKETGEWRITDIDPLPGWITENENKLQEFIEAEMSNA